MNYRLTIQYCIKEANILKLLNSKERLLEDKAAKGEDSYAFICRNVGFLHNFGYRRIE